MVEFRSALFVLSFFFFFIFFFFPRSFSQFLRLPFFLALSWYLAFLNSLSKFLHLLVHIMGDRFLSSPMKSTPISACSTSAWTYVLALILDPCLSSLLGSLDFNFNFLVLVAAIAIAENHLLVLVLVVRVGVSMRVRLRSVVRWQDTAAGAITWVSKLI